ncbi:MAG: hypothetical protein CML68_18970 [Rhodobacteraceae bacterium]|nr:hypothetical protein [Paracoccaceae bacterium]
MTTTARVRVATTPDMTCLQAKGAAYLNYAPRYTPAFVQALMAELQDQSPTVPVFRPDGTKLDVPWSMPVRDAFDLAPEAPYVTVQIDVLEADVTAHDAGTPPPLGDPEGDDGDPTPPALPVLDDAYREAFSDDTTAQQRAFLEDEAYEYSATLRGPFYVRDITGNLSSDALSLKAYEQYLMFKHGADYYPHMAESYLAEVGHLVDLRNGDVLEIDDTTPYGQYVIKQGGEWYYIIPFEVKVHDADKQAEIDGFIDGLSEEEAAAFNAATDAAFWDSLDVPPGWKIPSGQHVTAETWLAIRRDMAAKVMRVGMIPDDIKVTIHAVMPGLPLGLPAPGQEASLIANADTLIAITKRLMALSPSQRAAFAAQCGPILTLGDLQTALRDFEGRAEDKQEAVEARFAAGEKVAGMTKEFEQLQIYLDGGVGAQVIESILAERLGAWGYTGDDKARIAAFKADCDAYEEAFRQEAIAIARESLDTFDAELDGLSAALRDEEAMKHTFDEAKAITERLIADTDGMLDGHYLLAELKAASTDNPLLHQIIDVLGGYDAIAMRDDIVALFRTNDFDSVAAFKRDVQRIISKRKDGIDATRDILADEDNPDFIWRTGAIDQAMSEAGGGPDSMLGAVVQARKDDIAGDETRDAVLLGIAAVAAGLMTLGTGTVAVVGYGAGLGLSAYDAWNEYTRYVEDEAAAQGGLMATHPSMAWAVLALVGLGGDVIDVAKAGAKAMKTTRTATIAELINPDSPAGRAVIDLNDADVEELFDGP